MSKQRLSTLGRTQQFKYKGKIYEVGTWGIRSGGGKIGVTEVDSRKEQLLPASTEVETEFEVKAIAIDPLEVVEDKPLLPWWKRKLEESINLDEQEDLSTGDTFNEDAE